MTTLPAAAERVQDAAGRLGLGIAIRIMPESTRTAEDAARACGCTVGQIVKSLIFKGNDSDAPYLFLVSGDNRVNEKKVAAAVGEAIVRPDAQYVRNATGFAIGGIPPFGHTARIATFLDRHLFSFETVWAAAGTPNAVFEVATRQLADRLPHQPIDVT